MRPLLLAGLVALAGASAVRAAPEVVSAHLFVEGGQAVVSVTIEPGWHVNAHTPRDDYLIPTTLTLRPPPGVTAGEVSWPPPLERQLAFAGGRTALLYEGQVRITAPLAGTAAPGTAPLAGTLRFQACSDTRCLSPRSIDLVAAAPGAEGTAGAAAAPAGGSAVAGWIARWGYPLTLAWIFVLGAALNLTPCVYPLMSVTVAFFGGRSGHDRRAPLRAVVYVLGICVTFSALGAAAALTGSLFGAALQRPAVLGVLAVTMVALALSNFGLYQLRMPAALVNRAGRVGEGTVGAFFMGLTMGVVAAPCIGPVVATLLLYVGAQQSVALGLGFFFTLGLGLGLPYVGLALAAGRLRRMPRSGAWLAWMERLFGFVLLGVALHFATPLLPHAWVPIGWALLIVTAGAVLGFAGGNVHPAARWVRAAAGAAAIALGVSSLLVADVRSPIDWTPFSEQALTAAIAAERPVLIDFEADWCLPCREMERTTFRDPAVVRAARAFAALKVDATEEDDEVKALFERYRVAGVPTYVILGPDGRERKRLVGYIPAERMLEALRGVGPRRG
jgi:thiol:disulfide interchange protein DsbD